MAKHETSRDQAAVSVLGLKKKKPPHVTTGEAFLPPLQWRPHEHKEKQVHSPATNQPFVSQRQEVFRNTAENKHNYFPGLYIQAAGTAGGAFQDNSGAESWEKSAAKPERKQRRQRRTFVLARKTTRDRLTEEKSSCVQQREKEGGIRCREGGRVYCPPY